MERVCKPDSVFVRPLLWDRLHSRPQATYPGIKRGGPPHFPLLGLVPNGVYPAVSVTGNAVSSYLAVSPLPVFVFTITGGLFSVALIPGSRRLPVRKHSALWYPDFPLLFAQQRPPDPLRKYNTLIRKESQRIIRKEKPAPRLFNKAGGNGINEQS